MGVTYQQVHYPSFFELFFIELYSYKFAIITIGVIFDGKENNQTARLVGGKCSHLEKPC